MCCSLARFAVSPQPAITRQPPAIVAVKLEFYEIQNIRVRNLHLNLLCVACVLLHEPGSLGGLPLIASHVGVGAGQVSRRLLDLLVLRHALHFI